MIFLFLSPSLSYTHIHTHTLRHSAEYLHTRAHFLQWNMAVAVVFACVCAVCISFVFYFWFRQRDTAFFLLYDGNKHEQNCVGWKFECSRSLSLNEKFMGNFDDLLVGSESLWFKSPSKHWVFDRVKTLNTDRLSLRNMLREQKRERETSQVQKCK